MADPVSNLTPAETKLIKKEALKTKVLEIIKISTIPSVLKRIMEVTDDPGTCVTDLERIIERDQAVTSRIVAVSNAVFYGFSRKINSLPQAILVLGFDMVKGLAISTTVFNISKQKNRDTLTDLWSHSFETAVLSASLAHKTGLVAKESAFLAGLLHDIGRPIILQTCDSAYLDVCGLENESLERETDAFGATHAEAGLWFAEKCKLPEDCAASIRFHHSPEELGELSNIPPLLRIVYLANLLAADIKADHASISPMHCEITRSLRLTSEDIDKCCADLSARREEIRRVYS